MDSLLDFTGKSVLITGAAAGFGKLLSIELAKRGANLAISDINAEGLAGTVAELEGMGSKVVSCVGNVADESHSAELVKAAIDAYGKLDIAVNNAGISPGELQACADVLEETLDIQYNVNIKGVALGMKHQLVEMRKQQSGVILNVSSMAGQVGAPLAGSYCAAKHAVVGLTKTAAVEYAKENIRVNAICPFFASTAMVDNGMLNPSGNKEDLDKTLGRGVPMKRIAEPQEMVNVMVMMLSPQNTFMTGLALPVDGGLSAI